MRFPLKLNRQYWRSTLCRILPVANDVTALTRPDVTASQFGNAVCALKFGATFKTTALARYPLMIDALRSLSLSPAPLVLDVGASDGSASISTIEQLEFSRYYITDLNPVVYWTEHAGEYFFYDPSGLCILVATTRFIFYLDTSQALWPLGSLVERKLASAPTFSQGTCHKVLLINPAVPLDNSKVFVQQHDMFNAWLGEKPDIVIAANILNQAYFDPATLKRAIGNLVDALDGQGYLAIVDNRPDERGSLFRFIDGEATLVYSINGGAETERLVQELT